MQSSKSDDLGGCQMQQRQRQHAHVTPAARSMVMPSSVW